MHQAVLEWSNRECVLPRNDNCLYSCTSSSRNFDIKGPLTDVQLEYLREETDIKKLERNPTFIVVGAIGGVAVVALAISIFWGLNGSSFT